MNRNQETGFIFKLIHFIRRYGSSKRQGDHSTRSLIEVRGSLLKRDELSTIILIKGYTGEETAQWINAIFVVLLLIISGIMSILIAAKALALAILLAIISLFPLFIWRFVEFDNQSTVDRQRLEQDIKRSLEF